MSKALEKIEKFKRDLLKELYDKCTPLERDKFDRMYQGGPDKVPAERLDWSIQQCENTIENASRPPKTEDAGITTTSTIKRNFDEKKALHEELVRVRTAIRFMNDNEFSDFKTLLPRATEILEIRNDEKADAFVKALYIRKEEDSARILMQTRSGSPILN